MSINMPVRVSWAEHFDLYIDMGINYFYVLILKNFKIFLGFEIGYGI